MEDKVTVTAYIPKDLYKELRKISKKTGIKMSMLYSNLILKGLEKGDENE